MSKLPGLGDGSRTLRILVVRPDRLGDVILSTPVFEVIKRHYPNSKLTVLAQEGVVPLLEGLPSVDDVMIYEPHGKHAGFRGFFRLIRQIRIKRFRISVVLQSNWRIAAAILLGRVQYRVGPLSKLHSFLFFNRGVRQKRSQVEMHEADYNLQLLRKLGIRVGSRNVPTAAHISDENITAAREFLARGGWTEGPLVVVHPGMGGSALNWPETHYMDLVRALLHEGRKVLLTGGVAEHALLQRIADSLGPLRDKLMIYSAQPSQDIGMLGALMSFASVVVAPSTGPLHLAVALGRPVVTFYPPIRVQSAIRWGPYLRDDRAASIMTPEVYCGEDFSCRGNLCNYFPCMKTITVAEALEKVHLQIKQSNSE